jgi:hypothetical protein
MTSNYAANEFFGTAIAVSFRRVDQRHPERKARTHRFFFSGFRMSPLRKIRGSLTERGDDGAVREFNCPPWTFCSGVSIRGKSHHI